MSAPFPYYPQPSYQPYPPKNGAAVAALVLGIIALAVSFIPFLGVFLGIPIGIAGIILGAVGLSVAARRGGTHKSMSVTGLSLAAGAIVMSIVVTSVVSAAIGDGGDSIDDTVQSVEAGAPEATTGPEPTTAPTHEHTQTPTKAPEKAPTQAPTKAPEKAPAKAPEAPAHFPGQTDADTVVKPRGSVSFHGVVVTASPLVLKRDDFGRYLCSDVTYVNKGDEQESYNELDWNLQDPDGVIDDFTSWSPDDTLGSGDLAPGGKKTGKVCFDTKQSKPKGQYVLLLAGFISFSDDRGAWVNDL